MSDISLSPNTVYLRIGRLEDIKNRRINWEHPGFVNISE
jgi:hypothetical protein